MSNPPPTAPVMTEPEIAVGGNAPVAAMQPPQAGGNNNDISERELDRLVEQGYTQGLAKSLNDSKKAFHKRIWIVDNSGSMQKTDGHRLVDAGGKNKIKQVECTRWEEIQECVAYHIQLAAAMKTSTVFRLLNHPGPTVGPQQMSIAAEGSSNDVATEAHEALQWINKARPAGVTPLTNHIREIQAEVSSLAPTLRASGQRVVICICTDGFPTDDEGYGGEQHKQEFVSSLRSLEGLPVWMIIRLCTDEDDVVDFYNKLDDQLEISIEVLDDFREEAKEVHEKNAWLNYGLPLHRMRENGYHDRVFDLIDERALAKSELRDFFFILFGREKFDGVPDPSVNWEGFYKDIKRLTKEEKEIWNPISKKVEPWIDYHRLKSIYGESGCIIS